MAAVVFGLVSLVSHQFRVLDASRSNGYIKKLFELTMLLYSKVTVLTSLDCRRYLSPVTGNAL